MGPLQIVVEGDGTAPLQPVTVDNPELQTPNEIESKNPDYVVPRIGTDALLSLAVAAVADGLSVTYIDLRDTYFQALDPQLDDMLQDVLLASIRRGDLRSVRRVANGEARDAYVVGVEIAAPSGARLMVGRHGRVLPQPGLTRREVQDVLSRIWRRAGLG